jgi:transcriptional regulator with XRE-family HTH domain
MATQATQSAQAKRVLDQIFTEIRVEMTRNSETFTTAGRHFGVTPSSVSRKLSGDRALTVADLIGFADWLGVSATDLLSRAEDHTAKRAS